jgi:hypothetical protein
VAWVVDTSVLLDIRQNDPQFGIPAAKCLIRHIPEGLVLCPITYIELAPAFGGDCALQEKRSAPVSQASVQSPTS